MIVLDLFCGLGGWSRPWREAGDCVVTLDREASFRPALHMDARLLLLPFPVDVLLASPPCDEFSRWTMRGVNKTLRAKGVSSPSLDLVSATADLIRLFRPRFWVVENVHGSSQFISPLLGPHRGKYGAQYLWGNFPPLDPRPFAYRGSRKERLSSTAKAQRAEIPYDLASAMMACIKEKAPT